MRGQVGLARAPKGGLGNRLLTLISLRQIACFYGLSWFSKSNQDHSLVQGIRRLPLIPLTLRTLSVWDQKNATISDLELLLESVVERGGAVLLRPPLLGEIYARFAVKPAYEFLRPRAEMCEFHARRRKETTAVVVHLGSKSSHEWNPSALPGSDFFRIALQQCLEDSPADTSVRVCTDDLTNPAIESIREDFGPDVLLPGDSRCRDPFVCDFASMIDAEYLVSGPSTFSIVGGMLGSARIVQYSEWAQNRAAEGELFWRYVLDNTLPGYRVWKIL